MKNNKIKITQIKKINKVLNDKKPNRKMHIKHGYWLW